MQHIQRSTFDDLCQIYPCHEHLTQSADVIIGTEQSRVNSAAKIDRLCTADIVRILLQPSVLDTVVSELEDRFLSE